MSEGEPNRNSEQSLGNVPSYDEEYKKLGSFDDSLFNAPMPQASQNSEHAKPNKVDNQPAPDKRSDNVDNLPVPADHFDKYLAQEYVGILTTEEMKALEGKTEQEIDYYVKVGAFGKGVIHGRMKVIAGVEKNVKLEDSLWQRIKTDPELRQIMGEMKRAGAGKVIDQKPELADKLMAAFYGESVEKKTRAEFAGVRPNIDLAAVDTINLPGRIVGFFGRKHRAKMQEFDDERKEILADKSISEEQREVDWNYLNDRQEEYQEEYGHRAKYKLMGAVALGVIAGGVMTYMRVQHAWGEGGGGNKSGAADQAKDHFENNRVTGPEDHGIPDRINDLFKVPDPANSADKLHSHDFNHPIPSGANPEAFKHALDEQLRGNGVEMARYLSKAKIPGAPQLDQFHSQADYEKAITDYGHKLSGDHRFYAQQVELFNDKLNNATFEVRPLKAYGSDYIENGQYHWDPFVDRGVANGDVTIIHFKDGTPDIWVRNQCGQTVEELKEVVRQHVSQPTYTPHRTPQVITTERPHSPPPTHHETPPTTTPPTSTPPTTTPPTGTPPTTTTPTPTPPDKQNHFPHPGDGTFKPAPHPTAPASSPVHVEQHDSTRGTSSTSKPGSGFGGSRTSSNTGSSGAASSAGESGGSHSGDQGAPG